MPNLNDVDFKVKSFSWPSPKAGNTSYAAVLADGLMDFKKQHPDFTLGAALFISSIALRESGLRAKTFKDDPVTLKPTAVHTNAFYLLNGFNFFGVHAPSASALIISTDDGRPSGFKGFTSCVAAIEFVFNWHLSIGIDLNQIENEFDFGVAHSRSLAAKYGSSVIAEFTAVTCARSLLEGFDDHAALNGCASIFTMNGLSNAVRQPKLSVRENVMLSPSEVANSLVIPIKGVPYYVKPSIGFSMMLVPASKVHSLDFGNKVVKRFDTVELMISKTAQLYQASLLFRAPEDVASYPAISGVTRLTPAEESIVSAALASINYKAAFVRWVSTTKRTTPFSATTQDGLKTQMRTYVAANDLGANDFSIDKDGPGYRPAPSNMFDKISSRLENVANRNASHYARTFRAPVTVDVDFDFVSTHVMRLLTVLGNLSEVTLVEIVNSNQLPSLNLVLSNNTLSAAADATSAAGGSLFPKIIHAHAMIFESILSFGGSPDVVKNAIIGVNQKLEQLAQGDLDDALNRDKQNDVTNL